MQSFFTGLFWYRLELCFKKEAECETNYETSKGGPNEKSTSWVWIKLHFYIFTGSCHVASEVLPVIEAPGQLHHWPTGQIVFLQGIPFLIS